jgi:ferredoxin
MTSENHTATGPAGDGVEFAVEPSRCIGCTACVCLFPSLFRMDGGTAVAFTRAVAGSAPSGRVVHSCPTAAIHSASAAAVPPKIDRLVEVAGWETEWEKHREEPEDPLERERRYGRVLHSQTVAGCFVVRIELPRTLPNHPLIYTYGVRRRAPEYDCALVQIGPAVVSVRARLLDPRLQRLAGKLNSFPNGLKVDLGFPASVGSAYCRLDRDDMWVYAWPEEAAAPEVQLAALVRQQLGS